MLGLLGLIGLMSIFVKICSVHTPSSNPRLKPARSFSLKHRVSFLLIKMINQSLYLSSLIILRFLFHLHQLISSSILYANHNRKSMYVENLRQIIEIIILVFNFMFLVNEHSFDQIQNNLPQF